MKIYHTETQADYDALMEELEEQGIETLPKEYWKVHENQTVIFVHALCRHSDSTRTDTTYDSLGAWAFPNYPTVPIQKYKAKAEEKMRFTKENVSYLFREWKIDEIDTMQDLEREIIKLEAIPEKVVVPKFVAEWIEWNKESGVSLQFMLRLYDDFCVGDEEPDVSSEGLKAVHWYVDNPYKFIQAYEDGYTVEPDTVTAQRYTVVIADRYLVQLFIGRTDYRFVEFDELCAWKPNAFQLTEDEIKAIDERYWTFAVPAKEEKE